MKLNLHCDASNITGVVDKLYSLKLINRDESPTDRRVKILSLTNKGSELCQIILAELAEHHPAYLNKLSNEQTKVFKELLGLALSKNSK